MTSDKIIVLHLVNTTRRGGLERQLYTIIKNSHNIRNIVCSLYFPEKSYFSHDDINIINSRGFFGRSKDFREQIKKNSPDIIFTWSTLTYLIASIGNIGKNVPIINGSIRHGVFNSTLSGYFRMLVAHISPILIANSYAGLKANNLKLRNSRYVLYNGKELLYKKKIDEPERKKRLQNYFSTMKGNETVFITVANLVPFKDYKTVFYALAKIKEEKDFRYLIIGDGPMKEELGQLAKELNISNSIYFAGSVDNVLYYLQMADVMIHSSKGEGISNAILEGMFAGLPIIATNVGGIPETVFDKTSSLFQYQNVDELTTILMNTDQIISDSNKYRRELEDFLKRFSVETMILEYERIIKKIIRNN